MVASPTLLVEMQSGGWIMGDAAKSILGTSTYLTYSGWDDITPYVLSVDTRRGRQHELDQMQAGTATLSLIDPDGRFDPTNLSGPYVPTIRPGVRIRIRLTWEAVTYPVFYGFVEAWPQSFEGDRQGHGWLTIPLVDGFKMLNLASVHISSNDVDTTGERITMTLDAAQWSPDDRSIDPGTVITQPQNSDESSALAYLQTLAASEGTLIYVSRDGKFVFPDANFAPTFDPVNDVWGDGGGTDKPYGDITLSYDDSSIWNEIRVQSPDREDQVAQDDFSQGQFFRRSLGISTILYNTSDMATRAASLLARYKDPGIRIEELVVAPSDNDANWPHVLAKELHDKIRVIKHTPTGAVIQRDCFIEGINVTIANKTTRVAWALSPTGA